MSSERRYTPTHEWIQSFGDPSLMRVGITDFAQKEITDVVFVELPKIGKKIPQGAEVAIIESVKAAFSIYAPMGGEVVKVNSAIESDPALVNADPYGEGWLFEVRVDDPVQWNTLLDEKGYQALLAFGTGGGH
ncbi:MAG: Glycine cleavage H-protein [Leptospirillum sp. Group IV 'UBA BS']|nr:MAG: Glycine cleavage H-protein [Leptospirillum sp. Group IV 'UBA BS']